MVSNNVLLLHICMPLAVHPLIHHIYGSQLTFSGTMHKSVPDILPARVLLEDFQPVLYFRMSFEQQLAKKFIIVTITKIIP
jgi:hypothetical protein